MESNLPPKARQHFDSADVSKDHFNNILLAENAWPNIQMFRQVNIYSPYPDWGCLSMLIWVHPSTYFSFGTDSIVIWHK